MPCESTSSCASHLNRHRIWPPGVQPPPSEVSQASTPSSIAQYLDEQHPLHAEQWRNDFINWISHDDLTFEQAASPYLKKVIVTGGPQVAKLLPSARTVRTWLANTYIERVPEVRAALARSLSKIHVSFDAWSSPNDLSLLGVVGHWIDEHGQPANALLGLRPLEGHYGVDIAPVLHSIILTFNIEGKLGAFMMDNADNNDTALRALRTMLPPTASLDPKESRLRCLGHMINLVVKALLYGSRSSALQKELQQVNDQEAFKVWRQQGALGHLHNLVTYIDRSEQRQRAFEAAQKKVYVDAEYKQTLHLLKDTGVRWNSTYTMIERALNLDLALKRYCRDWRPAPHETYDLTADFLDYAEWEELRHLEELLRPFYWSTKHIEGNAVTGSHGALWEVIPAMDYLFTKLKHAANEIEEKPQLFTDHYQHCINHGFMKLRDYYTKIDDSRLYAAAIALHPCRRFNYFENAWASESPEDHKDSEATTKAKQQTRSLFNEYLTNHRVASPPATPQAATVATGPIHQDPDWHTHFVQDYTVTPQHEEKHLQEQQRTELDRFMIERLDIHYNKVVNGSILRLSFINEPLRWWRERGQALYPTLSIMALDLFAIPGMSSECERAFSSAKKMITDERYNLKYDIIEADQCVKSWFKSGIADGSAAFTNIADDEVTNEASAAAAVTSDHVHTAQ